MKEKFLKRGFPPMALRDKHPVGFILFILRGQHVHIKISNSCEDWSVAPWAHWRHIVTLKRLRWKIKSMQAASPEQPVLSYHLPAGWIIFTTALPMRLRPVALNIYIRHRLWRMVWLEPKTLWLIAKKPCTCSRLLFQCSSGRTERGCAGH